MGAMEALTCQIGAAATDVRVGPGALSGIGEHLRGSAAGGHVLVVTDDHVGPRYGDTVTRSLADAGLAASVWSMPAGEPSKCLAQAATLYQVLCDRGVGRDGVVLALGGGVVSDLAGYVAATWMRGVALAICPTTVEAAIDASIGGKTAVNLPAGKNLVGAFHPAVLVVVDPACFATLSARDVRAGLAESMKHAILSSASFVAWHEARVDAILGLDADTLTELVVRNIRFKAEVVAEDPYERLGRRAVLNFGHTFGHAIEARAGYALRHGECVAIGMVAACRLSAALGLLDADVVDRVARLIAAFGLPTAVAAPLEVDDVWATMTHDKKKARGRLRFVVLDGIGRPAIRDDVPRDQARAALASVLA
ncbi:MAG: 3-dehydroquinate synthase [Phycisphaerae bacterium]